MTLKKLCSLLIDLILAVTIAIGCFHVGGALAAWAKKMNTPFQRVSIVLEELR